MESRKRPEGMVRKTWIGVDIVLERKWKLGDDLFMDSDILHAITFEDLALILNNDRDFQEQENHNAAYMKKVFRQMIQDQMQDALYFIENNTEEILRDIFPETYKVQKHLTDQQCEELAYKIYDILLENEMWIDVRIYFNGKALCTGNGNGTHRYNGKPFILEDIDPTDYFDYVADPNVISMSFEGPVYGMFNYEHSDDVLNQLMKLFSGYGLYYELGNAWNLSLYKI